MSSNTLPKLNAFRLKTLVAAIASAILFSNAEAAGLGDLTVLSSLGQPLRAEVELILNSKADEGALTVKLASFEAFRQANIEFNPALPSLRFAVERRGDRQVVRVTSVQPMNEPFIDMLLELSGSSSRVVREYIFLLDPASLYSAQAEVVSPSAASTAPALQPKPVQASPAANKPAPQAAQAAARSAAPTKADARPADRPATPASIGGKPRLTLSSPMAASGPGIPMAEYAAMEKAVAAADERVKVLEQKVGDLQKLLEVTNSLLEELRKHNELAKADLKPAAASAAESPAAPDIKPAAPAVPAPAVPAKPTPAAPPPDTGWSDELYLLPGAGLLLALLGAFGIYTSRRRKAHKPQAATMFADSIHATNPVPAAAGSHGIDAGAGVISAGGALPGAQTPTGEVDVVSEADVYIAFGRDVQAEQVLKEALRIQPQRHAARVKLLTIYATRKDLQAFESLARELYSMTKGEGDAWMQAATMGIEIDPANPLYAAGKLPAKAAVIELLEEPAAAASPAMPLPLPESEPAADAEPAALADPLANLTPTEEIMPVAVASNALDFDLSGMDAEETAVPAIPSPLLDEPTAEAAAVDFDVLLPEVPFVSEEPKEEPAPLDFDFLLPELPGAATTPEAASASLDEPKAEIGLLDLDFLLPDTAAGAKPEAADATGTAPPSRTS